MKHLLFLSFLLFSVTNLIAKNKNVLLDYLTVGKTVQAEMIFVEPHSDMAIYSELIKKAQKKDPEWFKKHQTTATAGTPLPYHKKLMSKKQYNRYLACWKKRKIQPRKGRNGKPVRFDVKLVKDGEDYSIFVQNTPISLLNYTPKTNSFQSTEGKLAFLEDINAPAEGPLGKWTGKEWRFKESNRLYTTRMNFAIGRMKKKRVEYGLLIYRYQRFDSYGRFLANENVILRFAPVKKAKK